MFLWKSSGVQSIFGPNPFFSSKLKIWVKKPSKSTPLLDSTSTKLSFTQIKGDWNFYSYIASLFSPSQIYNHGINDAFTQIYTLSCVFLLECFMQNKAFPLFFTNKIIQETCFGILLINPVSCVLQWTVNENTKKNIYHTRQTLVFNVLLKQV